MKPQRPLSLFIRKFLPLSRRAIVLFFKGRSKSSYELFHAKKTSGKLIDTTVNLKVNNGLILQVNGHSLPIYSDDQTITLRVPNSSPQLEIKLRGLFGSVSRTIDVQESVVQLNSPRVKFASPDSGTRIHERNAKIQVPDVNLKRTQLNLKSRFSLHQINNSFIIKQLEPNSIKNLSITDVSKELETTLTTNQIHYEK